MSLIRVKIDDVSYYYEDDKIGECKDIILAKCIYAFNNIINNFIKIDFNTMENLTEMTLINCNLQNIPILLYDIKNLKLLNLNHNKIEIIDEKIKNLKNLEEFYISYNKLKTLPEDIGTLKNLTTLCISENNINELPKTIGNLRNLKYLYINNNNLLTIPSEIVECINILYILFFPQNRNFKIKPHVLKFINRYSSSNYQTKVYSNTENVHTTSIQNSLRKSLLSLLNDKIDTDFLEYSEWLDDTIKNDIDKYCKDNTELYHLYVTFSDVYKHVMNRILKSPHKKELIIRLHEEMIESKNLCFVGRITRLVNVLNGFYQDIHIGISENEQIENIIISCLKQTEYDIKILFKNKMEERGYGKDLIDMYLAHIEDFINQ